MNDALFDIVFKGKFVRQIDEENAVLHFSKLFKMPIDKAQRFFDGKPRALKKSLNLEKASQFRSALKKAGLRVSMVKLVSEELSEQHEGLTLSEPGVVIVDKAFIQPQHFDTSQFSLDEVGSEIVEPEFIEKLEFDLSEYEMDEVGAIMVEAQEIPDANIDTSGISLDEVGAIFAQKKQVEEPSLDISNISMEEVGATLVEKKAISEPEINIDGIELVE